MIKSGLKIIIRNLIISFLAVILIITGLYYLNIIGQVVFISMVYAVSLNFINAVIAFFAFEFSIDKSNQLFLIYNFGGQIARIFFLLAVIFISIKVLNLDKYTFIFTFFVFYFITLIYEITVAVKRVNSGKNK